MLLIIDTVDKICEVASYDGDNIDSRKWQWKKDTGGEVLKNLQKLLKRGQKKLQDIEAIIVNQGPGSYTGTRVGITIANALGWTLDIPVFGYSGKEPAIIAKKTFQKLKSGQIPLDRFPTPKY